MFKKNIILYLFLPPLMSLILLLRHIYTHNEKKYIVVFLFFYTLFVTYFYPDYDTFLSFYDSVTSKGFLSNDLISNMIGFIGIRTGLNFYSVFPLLWLTAILLYYKSMTNCCEIGKVPFCIFLILIFSLILKNWLDLTYSTLASSIAVFFGTIKNKKFLYFILFFVLVFFIHPGVIMVFLPAAILYFLYKKHFNLSAQLFLIIYAIFTFLLFNAELVFSFEKDSLLYGIYNRFVRYVDQQNIWGGIGLEMSFLGYFNIAFTCVFIFVSMFVSFKHRNLLKYNFSYSLLIVGSIALMNSISLWTLRERFFIICIMASVINYTFLIVNNRFSFKYKNILVYSLIVLYTLPIWFHRKTREIIFRDVEATYDISLRTLYVPSILLITDVEDFGYSDKFIISNATFGSDLMKWRRYQYHNF